MLRVSRVLSDRNIGDSSLQKDTGFYLSKWYLDCVADNGDTFTSYAALLRWRILTLHYSSFLFFSRRTGMLTKTSLRRHAPPCPEDGTIRWVSAPLAIEGSWTQDADPIEQQLLDSPDGAVTWSCMQPRAKAHVLLGGQTEMRGLGYAEHMKMTIRPWRLPIRELRWGRFLSETDAVVWIDWIGNLPQTYVFHNGRLDAGGAVTDREIISSDGKKRLSLTGGSVLREGALGSTVLAAVPGMNLITPLRTLRTHERKWRSHGVFTHDSEPLSDGWAIHELVRFA